ncbi:fam-a protein [Plasmodium berghei]|uniref:Fam-a protein n=2 Tax=Plasmodium berghei TaxID=5821 RepID=A0A509AH18_PLABA|nr:fam-a protein [Plasmodium berghei ANKA]CXI21222.1 fam-a protein [Plasmodium berghei]SBW38150.1 fam-a protein [Plasmodium berghei]SCL81898.1 fam-a protein [Plasmodium berghei]SCL82181.1 fam-a protein [Plasmodium berghei]SCL82428.1 fam-a protein [Plasmodium berghei]|eukprot:XP_034420736.1 fam-a protein [Plasmodium berghei ANKA]
MNNGYVKIYFFALIFFGYVNNQALTTDRVADNATSSKTTPSDVDSLEESSFETTSPKTTLLKRDSSKTIPSETSSFKTLSEIDRSKTAPSDIALPIPVLANPPSPHITIYKKNKHLLCTNPLETKKAMQIMDEAVELLRYYATTKEYYKHDCTSCDGVNMYYKKLGHNTYIGKCQLQIYNPNKYNDIIKILWDLNGPKKFDDSHIKGKVVRSYNQNLLMILKFYKNMMLSSPRYFYALAKKAQISENTSIIVMASGNINDNNPFSTKTFKNKIIKSINSFKTSVCFDNDIQIGYFKKTFVNLSGYLIEKKDDHVDVTFVNSINFNPLIPTNCFIKNANTEAMLNFTHLKYYFDN